jgi:hypothetical protein
MTTENWPQQAEVSLNKYYGNPRGRSGTVSDMWAKANLVYVKAPFVMTYAGKPITKGCLVHKKCKDAFAAVFEEIWDAAGRDQNVVDDWGASVYAGAFNYRLIRGGNRLSTHSWGCAIDLDPARNGFHDTTPHFTGTCETVKAFERHGFTWGGRWSGRSCDGMHFQAARV